MHYVNWKYEASTDWISRVDGKWYILHAKAPPPNTTPHLPTNIQHSSGGVHTDVTEHDKNATPKATINIIRTTTTPENNMTVHIFTDTIQNETGANKKCDK